MYGIIAFVVIPITYEELMSRVSPYYLVTINVLLTMGSQIVSTVVIYVMGILLKTPGMMYV